MQLRMRGGGMAKVQGAGCGLAYQNKLTRPSVTEPCTSAAYTMFSQMLIGSCHP